MSNTPPAAHTLVLDGRVRYVAYLALEDWLRFDLADGRSLLVPLAWFPRLANVTAVQRAAWQIIGDGVGASWPELDVDICVENLLGYSGQLALSAPAAVAL